MKTSPATKTTGKMTLASVELLISVRSLTEARQAAGQPIDILDFKEPRAGALAPVDPSLWHDAIGLARAVGRGRTIPLSAALGERETAIELAGEVPPQFSFAKAGPQGCRTPSQLKQLWTAIRGSLPQQVQLVAVAYSDSVAAETLPPEEVVVLAGQCGIKRILVDTFVKDDQSSVQHLATERLRLIRQLTREHGLRWMLAGSIRERDLDNWLDHDTCPDGFGVRGDICQSDRTSDISPERIACWRSRLDQSCSVPD